MNEKDVIEKLYSALNRNDISTILGLFDPNILRVEWEGTPSQGVFQGLKEVEAHFIEGREKWAEGGCEPQRFITYGNKVVVLVHVKVRLKDKIEWNEGDVADAFAFRNGKITEMRSFFQNQQAIDWAQT